MRTGQMVTIGNTEFTEWFERDRAILKTKGANHMKSTYEASAEAFMQKTGTQMEVAFDSYRRYFPDDKESRNVYRITLKRDGRSYRFHFGQSINNTESGEEPSAYDVLTCLTKSDPGTFEDFCSQYDGYDTDSRTAERTYKAVVKEWAGVQRLFSDVLSEMAEIQ